MKKIAVLISGQGNNLQAIIDACQTQQIPAEIVCVISNKANAFGLIRAQSAGIFSRVFLRNNFESNLAMDQSIADELDKFDVDLIVLAGYMKILTPEFIQRFEGKIINIHPSLLPKYPGLNTYQKALDTGDREHGTTVHFVNEEVDNGAIILQAKVPIFDNDTVEVIEARTREQEYRIYPIVVKWFVENRLKLQNGVAYLDDIPLPEQGYANN